METFGSVLIFLIGLVVLVPSAAIGLSKGLPAVQRAVWAIGALLPVPIALLAWAAVKFEFFALTQPVIQAVGVGVLVCLFSPWAIALLYFRRLLRRHVT